MVLEYSKVRYRNKYYAVIRINYKELDLPTVIDFEDLYKIKNLNKNWRCNKLGFISCIHTYNNETKEVFLHDIIMALKQKSLNEKPQQKPILHINRIGLDNRKENLIYDTTLKDENKNLKKKKRTIELPIESGIDINEIPTYVWYMKPNGLHGERFMIDIGDVQWKTTSSKKLSLRYKLEEAKMFLRNLKQHRPDLFSNYSMNGDFTSNGKELLDGYYTIVHRAGFKHIKRYIPKDNTDLLLKQTIDNKLEKKLLKQQEEGVINILNPPDEDDNKRRRVINNLPQNCSIQSNDIPKYCYYRPKYKNRGDYFVIENHPLMNDKIWQTTSSQDVSTDDKFLELLEYLNKLEDTFTDNTTEIY